MRAGPWICPWAASSSRMIRLIEDYRELGPRDLSPKSRTSGLRIISLCWRDGGFHMKRKRLTAKQIISILKKRQASTKIALLGRKRRISDCGYSMRSHGTLGLPIRPIARELCSTSIVGGAQCNA